MWGGAGNAGGVFGGPSTTMAATASTSPWCTTSTRTGFGTAGSTFGSSQHRMASSRGGFAPATTSSSKPSQSAQVLQETYTKMLKEKEELEKKLTKARLLSKKISKMKLSENFMFATDQDLLEKEIKQSTEMINKSVELNDQIKKLEEQIREIILSDNLLKAEKINQMMKEIQIKQEAIEKATSVRNEISLAQKNVDFLQDSDIEDLQKELDRVQFVFKEILASSEKELRNSSQEGMNALLQVQENARRELECIICLQIPESGTQVLSCLEHHLLCLKCSTQNLQLCPLCRQNFQQVPPARNRLAEKMIQQLI